MSYGFRRVNESAAYAVGKVTGWSVAEMLLTIIANTVLSTTLAIMLVANTATGIWLTVAIMAAVNVRFTFRFVRDVKFLISTSRWINREIEDFVGE